MWLKETPDGVVVDVEGIMGAIESRRKYDTKRLRHIKDEPTTINITEDSDDILLKAGGKYFKLISVKETSSIEDLLKEDYEKQLEVEKNRLTIECQGIVNEFKAFAEHSLQEGENEIRTLRERLKNSAPMPEIGYAHAKAGLSVVKGDGGQLIWLFHTVYAPQFVNDQPLTPSITKKMTTPMVIMVRTKDEDVLGVETRTISLDHFRHYHRHNSDNRRAGPGSDCWGQWKYAGRKVKSTDEVLALVKEAANVLANVNTHSPACRNPIGLPRLSTLESNVMARGADRPNPMDQPVRPEFNPTQIRAGIDAVIINRGGWNT